VLHKEEQELTTNSETGTEERGPLCASYPYIHRENRDHSAHHDRHTQEEQGPLCASWPSHTLVYTRVVHPFAHPEVYPGSTPLGHPEVYPRCNIPNPEVYPGVTYPTLRYTRVYNSPQPWVYPRCITVLNPGYTLGVTLSSLRYPLGVTLSSLRYTLGGICLPICRL